jgi:phosphohistidine phosphatase SixA
MSKLPMLLLCVVLAVLPAAIVVSEPWAPRNEVFDRLRLGGYVIVLRHGVTNSDVANKDPMSNPARKTSVERQLNEQGRAQAEMIGGAMRQLWIPVSSVMTSPLQRAVDTGTLLGFGKVVINSDLAEAGPAVAPDENNRRADALRKLVEWHQAGDGNLVIVTHKPNLVDAFGNDWADIREGEASVFEPDFAGTGYRLIGRIQADQWSNGARG